MPHRPHTDSSPPTLSIVTPVLNAGATLRATLESIASLSSSGIEHIIVDGGSVDGSLAILDEPELVASHHYPRKLLHDEANGISNALNQGITEASGAFILILNADDTLYPEEVDRLVDKLETRRDCQTVYYGNAVQYDPETGRQFDRVSTLEPIEKYMSLYHGALFFPRLVHEHLGLYDPTYRFAMDVELVHRCLAADVVFEHIPATLTRMRLRGRSHLYTAEAMAEFERSVVSHRLQTPLIARLYRIRQTTLHELLKFSWFQAAWTRLRRIDSQSSLDSPQL